ncbi:MAG: tetratricopeptide repeat protein [Pseudomonadota bacterium]|nr:tetratricopeptide repeat protein [Pseudomonadota bacterium]
MFSTRSVSHLLLISALATAPVSAHGPGHDKGLTSSSNSRNVEAAPEGKFFPAHLLAAVCGLHEHHHGTYSNVAFERRVELVKLAQEQKPMSDDNPPLYDNLGQYSYPITTRNRMAQRYFDQGLRLTYAFNHFEAWRAFRMAQRLDPKCAMCYWGEAYVLGPNINAPMEPAAIAPAIAAIKKASALADGANKHEQALITALTRRYSADPDADQTRLNKAYADAMSQVAARFPADVDIVTLYADALMNLSPWDYWKTDRRTPKPAVEPVVDTLERALAKAPDHPYAIHLYIHAVEASSTPERAEPYADRLAAQIPGAGHIVHMPFHIYFRTGRFRDAIESNRAAVAADEAYLAQAQVSDLYAYGYYPHNVHSLLESARMAGDGKTALKAAQKLPQIMSDEVAAAVPWVQLIKAAPYFAHAQFSEPKVTLSVSDPGDRFPYIKAMWHYARGVAQAARGDTSAALREQAAITAIQKNTNFDAMVAGGVPVSDLLRLARHVVAARIAQAQGNYDQAIRKFEQAVSLQNALPYMEPPFWYYPVSQSLGSVLLQAGKSVQAEEIFRQSLKEFPNNGWALYGLMRAQKAQGDAASAARTQKRFEVAWIGDESELKLDSL